DQVNKFSKEEVAMLLKEQFSEDIYRFHPYTCENRSDGNHPIVCGDKGILIPTIRGWICPFCDYTQDWHTMPLELIRGVEQARQGKLSDGPASLLPGIKEANEAANKKLEELTTTGYMAPKKRIPITAE